MRKGRLLKLAALLEKDADNKRGVKFNLSTVISTDKDPKPRAKTVPMTCGTSACAMGLAALSGEFAAGGLSYVINRQYVKSGGDIFIETTMHGEVTDFDDAACELFDIDQREANFLFTPSYYGMYEPIQGAEGERYVAKRIRDFVAGRVAP